MSRHIIDQTLNHMFEDFDKQQRRQQIEIRRAAEERAGFAEFMFNALRAQLVEFDKSLKPSEEIGALIASFGSTILVSIREIGFRSPHLILLRGVDQDGSPVELLQHVSQVNMLLRAVPLKAGQSKRKIGFNTVPS